MYGKGLCFFLILASKILMFFFSSAIFYERIIDICLIYSYSYFMKLFCRVVIFLDYFVEL